MNSEKNKGFEILAPCGSAEAVRAAVCSGCDSIYIGAGSFNARAYADSFDTKALKEIIDYAHLRGVKVYITFNILYKQSETDEVLRLAAELYSLGADAFITADIGIFHVFKTYFKDIAINASTQLGVHSSDSALWLKRLGADRIILARELSLKDIRAIYDALGDYPDLEAFVHGALCVCYSGRCLFSSFLGGRSGNRGRCAQPCRLEYSLFKNGKKTVSGPLLSPKDIMCAHSIKALADNGVRAFKIEGRMKDVPYVVRTVKTYRKQLDAALAGELASLPAEEEKELRQVFSRGGSHSEGYLYDRKGRHMMSSRVKNTGREIGTVTYTDKKGIRIRFFEDIHPGDGIEIDGRNTGSYITKEIKKNGEEYFHLKGQKGDRVFLSLDKRLTDRLSAEGRMSPPSVKIKASFRAAEGAFSELKLWNGFAEVTEIGSAAQKAQNCPVSAEDITKRLSKTGNTPFSLDIERVEIPDNIFIAAGEINSMRRRACDRLEECIKEHFRRKPPMLPCAPVMEENTAPPFLSAEITTEDQLRAAVVNENIKRIYINDPKLVEKALDSGKEIFFAFPKIMRENSLERVFREAKGFESTSVSGFLIRNLTTFETDKKIVCDHTLGVFNTYTAKRLLADYDEITLSPELSPKELLPLCGKNTEIIAWGRLPLMVTEQCPAGNFLGDNRGGMYCRYKNGRDRFYLTDRMGEKYPLNTHCEDCFCEIESASPLSLGLRPEKIKKLRPSSFRLIFTDETEGEVRELTEKFSRVLLEGKNEPIEGSFPKGVL